MPTSNRYCAACGQSGGLHKVDCLANQPVHLVGQQAQPRSRPTGWICPVCGWEPLEWLIPQPPDGSLKWVAQFAVNTIDDTIGETTARPHCNVCYIRFLRANIPLVVPKSTLKSEEGGPDGADAGDGRGTELVN